MAVSVRRWTASTERRWRHRLGVIATKTSMALMTILGTICDSRGRRTYRSASTRAACTAREKAGHQPAA
ncbi:hypothetical protein BDZ89DRAFT_176643 [Hymenopellis radicata]|nr:hypothetical protein BDZ89DRAFT_176643 [Hymenopellis radicata]